MPLPVGEPLSDGEDALYPHPIGGFGKEEEAPPQDQKEAHEGGSPLPEEEEGG